MELIQLLLEAEPDVPPPAVRAVADPEPSAPPPPLELLARAAVGYAVKPQKAVELQVQLLRIAAKLTRNPVLRQMALAAMPGLRFLRRLAGETADSTVPPVLALGRRRRRRSTGRSRLTDASPSGRCDSTTRGRSRRPST